MKILVLSLLRLGDIVLHKDLLVEIRNNYPNSEIHLMINKSFKVIQPLMEVYVNKFIHFDRDGFQSMMTSDSTYLLAPHITFKKWIEEINTEKYDLVINATHNQFSARLMDLIVSREYRGIRYSDLKVSGIDTKWMNYLNEIMSVSPFVHFHYSEVLIRALGFKNSKHISKVKNIPINKKILIQPYTSDTKKDWGVKNWKTYINLMLKEADTKLTLVCSPLEEQRLLADFSDVLGVVEYIKPSFHELIEVFNENDLLVTGDTSVKHLAGWTDINIIEIVLGSSDWRKTATLRNNVKIVTSKQYCSPCMHSQSCHREKKYCEEDISPQQIVNITKNKSKDYFTMKQAAFNYYTPDSKPEYSLDQLSWICYLDSVEPETIQNSELQSYRFSEQFLLNQLEQVTSAKQFFRSQNNISEINFDSLNKLDPNSGFSSKLKLHLTNVKSENGSISIQLIEEYQKLILIKARLIRTLLKYGDVYESRAANAS